MAIFGDEFKAKWTGDDNRAGLRDKLGVLGVGLSQLSAGQAPNIMPAWEAVENRRNQRKLAKGMANPEFMAGFTPEQQSMLSAMPPEMAQALIMEKMFAPPPAPIKADWQQFGGDMYDMNSRGPDGKPAMVMDGMGEAELSAQKRTADRELRRQDGLMLGYADGSPEMNSYVVSGDTAATVDTASYGTTLQFWTDDKGETKAGVIGTDGTLKSVEPPMGGDWSLGIEKIDLGTSWQIRDKRTGAVIGTEPKDLRGVESEKVIGEMSGKAEAAAVGDVSTADTTLAYIKSLRDHPGREWGTGASAWSGAVPGTGAKDFAIENKRLASGAFMVAIEQMRGMGALSNAEGQTATAAIAALQEDGTEEGYLKRLAEYEEIVLRGRARAIKRIKFDGTPMDGAAATAPDGNADADFLKSLGLE